MTTSFIVVNGVLTEFFEQYERAPFSHERSPMIPVCGHLNFNDQRSRKSPLRYYHSQPALLLLVACMTAKAAPLDKETLIKKQVQLQIALAQADYCNKEFDKLESQTQTPFMLDQKNPTETNKRFSENKLSIEEEIAY